MDGLSRELQPTLIVRKVFHSKLTEWQILAAKKIESGGDRMRTIFHIGQVQVNVVLLIQPSSAAAE